ncbi:MAG: hypothetical protein JNM67_01835 [Bacteroidetes bacterium]|nr:hypothetical protein [Bacteroidota bacterium]
MKELGNIYLVWRKGKGNVRIPVGLIKKSATKGVRFGYIKEGVLKAQQYGFTCYEGFPDISKEYSENVLEKFGQRLMKSERTDSGGFYSFWGIRQEFKDDTYYVLAYSQGLLPTDNFEFLADFNPQPELIFISEIAGLSSTQLSNDTLQIGDKLTYKLESSNEYDKNAVSLFKGEKFLGYIKLIHSRVFYKVNKTISIKVHAIEKNGIIKRVFIKIGE